MAVSRAVSRGSCRVSRGVALVLAMAVLWLAAPEIPALEAGGLELTSPVKQGLKRLQEKWQEWKEAYLQNDAEAANTALKALLATVEGLGMSKLPDLSVTAAAFAVRSAQDGNLDRARWTLDAARQLDPERPETHFAAATVERLAGNYGAAVTSTFEGYASLFRLPLLSRIFKQNLGLAAIYLGLLSGGFFLLLQMGARGASLFYDLGRLVSPPLPAGTAEAVAVLILIWPVFLPSGILWLALYWSVLLWGYGSPSVRFVLILLWILAGAAPVAAIHQEREVRMSLLPATRAVESLRTGRLYGNLFLDLDVLQSRAEGPVLLEIKGDLHRAFGQWEHARLIYNSLIEDEDAANTAPALVNLGIYHYLNDDYGTAVRYFTDASEADPRLPEAYYNLSMAHGRLFDFPAQHTAMATAKNLDPNRVSRWERAGAGAEGGAEVISLDGGLRRADEILAELAAGTQESAAGSSAWQAYLSTATALLAAVLAVMLNTLRQQRGYPSAKFAYDTRAGNRWVRALVPGWKSTVEGNGVAAFLAILLPMAFLVAPLVAVWGYRVPLGLAPGRGLALGLSGIGLGIVFLIRLGLAQRR